WTRRLAVALAVGTLFQAPLGYLTVKLHLNPVLVMSHLLLSFALIAGAVVIALAAVGVERGAAPPLVPREVRWAGAVLAVACYVLVVTGTFVTAAGPHPGDRAEIRRLGTVAISIGFHAGATALFGCAFVFVLGSLAARRARVWRL